MIVNEVDRSRVEGRTVNNIEGLQSHEILPPQTDTQLEGGGRTGGRREGRLEGGLEGKGEGGLCQEREGLTYREGGTRVFIKWIEFPNRPVFAA